MNIITLTDIAREYKVGDETTFALKDVSLEIKEGEILVIMGPSGSGKSTLMNIISGLDRPTSGVFKYMDTDMQKAKTSMLAVYRQRVVGMIFQSFNLIPALTVKDNIKLSRILASYKKKESETDIKDLLKTLGIESKLKYIPTKLSGGQQQRVAIARALINDPEIILADEPTGNLDTVSGNKIISILEKLNKSLGKTIVIITHNPDIANIADRVIYMKDGLIEKVENKTNKENDTQTNSTAIDIKKQKPGKIGFKQNIMLSLLNIKRSKVRTFLTSFGVAVGIASLVLLVSFAAGLQKTILDTIASPKALKQIQVTQQTKGGGFSTISDATTTPAKPITYSNFSDISKLNHVETVYSMNSFTGAVTFNKKIINVYFGFATPPIKYIDLEDPSQSFMKPKIGSLFKTDEEESIILPENAAKSFGFSNPKDLIGKKVTVDLDIQKTDGPGIQATLKKDLTVVGLTGSDSIPLIPNKLIALNSKNNTFSSLTVIVDNLNNVNDVETKIKDMGYGVSDVKEIIGQVQQVFLIVQLILGVIGGIALVVASLGIINIMLMSVLERFKEIGIMKAVGARPRDIQWLFITEASLIGFFGGLIGIAIGWGAGFPINYAINQYIKNSGNGTEQHLFFIPLYLIGIAIALSVIVSILAALYPSTKAARLNPIDALRRE